MGALVYCILASIALVNNGVNPFESSRELEGYPTGYLSDCPGSTKPAIISEKSKKKLAITVLGPNGKRIRYREHQAKDIYRNPYIDFKNKDTLFFIAGFLDAPNLSATVMGPEYLKRGYNVLMIESHIFLTTHFPISVRLMRPLARFYGGMLADIVKTGLDPKRLHMMGISLGGQTVSFIAKSFTNITGLKPGRVTGLDPGGPCFRHLGPDSRLDESDADFVDVVLTNIDGYGMAAPVGHVNFYINGGEFQPADFYLMPCSGLCSHIRSFFIWLSSVMNPDSFVAIKCNSVQQARNLTCYDNVPTQTNVLGNKVDKTKPGIYFLATGSDFPYFLGEAGLKRENEFWAKNLGEFNTVDVLEV